MKILHTVQFYSPNIGGAQEVVRQVSERLTLRGHQVIVATSRLEDRKIRNMNGVEVEEFDISGNAVLGFKGETKRYQDFLLQGKFDLMMNYAAQQWATDLALPILDRLPYKKVLIPCGFSGLYWPRYARYFKQLPERLNHYDHLIFHAENYRDMEFAGHHGLEKRSIIPNGASQEEFSNPDLTFRQRYGIEEKEPLILTVGSHTGLKGHKLAFQTFERLRTERATLVIIGDTRAGGSFWENSIRPFLSAIRRGDMSLAGNVLLRTAAGKPAPGCSADCQMRTHRLNAKSRGKRVLLLDPPRAEVVAAYHAADLFFFGSNIEYSPLVLFEAMASRTPFLSLACGNAVEIAAWSGGGIIAPTIQKERGFVDGDPAILSEMLAGLINDPAKRSTLADQGHRAWLEHFTWERLVDKYETLYHSLLAT
jgi:glycosyltransferase involved in cell wall biosynthesis